MLKFHPLKVKSRSEIAEDAIAIVFDVPPELRELYRFEAGQHLVVHVPNAQGPELRRTYSIASPVGSADLRIGVRVQKGGRASPWLAEQLRVGDSLQVLTPNGRFHTQLEPQRAKRYVAFAAGSGITPVLSVAETVLAQEPASRFLLFYGNRRIASAMFLEDILALKNRYPTRVSVHFLMSREPQDIELLNGRLDGNKVHELAAAFFQPDAVDEYFICGPGTMVQQVSEALQALGASGKIHTEIFTATDRLITNDLPSSDALVETHASTQVTVVMDGRRRAFTMPREGRESVLDAAARAGIDLPYSCRAGICSTCRTRVVKGSVRMDHNVALDDWEVEAGYVLCCQSRPTSVELEVSYDE
jgi:ring-1,2-phenylacetyl-CoA epoxidase subunit PaaE